MRTFFVLTVVLFFSCKTQENQVSEIEYIKLPACNMEKSMESKIINSINYSSMFNKCSIIVFNKKEYPIDKFNSIIDTIDISNYLINIKVDSLSNVKSLIIEKSP